MEPTIKRGENITIDFGAYLLAKPRRWDVVAFKQPIRSNAVQVQRVIGLPGETVSLSASGIVVNGSVLAFPSGLSNVVYTPPERLPQRHRSMLIQFPYTIPAEHYFVTGDNWTNSYDSKFFGAVSLTNIVGRVGRD